ncbi:MAG: DUF421 domain-containing protein [Chloroflexi bacterium]|nr:DUF421 domain-containing protein [Chloroflexota bacterium]
MFTLDWELLFIPQISIAEILLRGTVMYLILFVMLRFVLKRESGTVGITDLLLVVLLADAAQNGLAGQYKSITEGVLLVATLIFWNYTLNWVGYHIPALNRLVYPRSLPLVEAGKILWPNMRRELITENELMSKLREQNIEDMKEVKEAYMEGDGQISVIKYKSDDQPSRPQRRGI